jgi:phospholipase/carboxylesterase
MLARMAPHTPLDTLEHQTGPAPTASIVVLHGLGADGNDFVPIAQELDLSAVGPVRFIFPHAPVRSIAAFGGQAMRAWYGIPTEAASGGEDEAGLRESQAQVQALLDREAARGIAPDRTVLMGFSQGCAMTLMTGLRATQRLAGLVGLSGRLPLPDTLTAERSDANRDVPIFLAHGRQDPVIPFDRGIASRDTLAALGYAVAWHEYRMEHSVCPEEIGDLNRWLLKVLAR